MKEFQRGLVEVLFRDARERYRIKLRREAGAPKPWTEDPWMRDYHLCNVFRDDDAVSRYIMRQWLPLWPGREWAAVVTARLINSEVALAQIRQGKGLDEVTINTSAYKLNTPLGLNSRDGIRELIRRASARDWRRVDGLEEAHGELRATGLSAFIAYQAVQDLRGSALPAAPPDADTWAYTGVGAVRGAFRLRGGRPEDVATWCAKVGKAPAGAYMREMAMPRTNIMAYLRREVGIPKPTTAALGDARELLELSRLPALWPAEWPRWHMGEAAHMLCEYDKLARWRQIGPGAARRFRG